MKSKDGHEMPSEKEVLEFMIEETKPYEFRYVKGHPLRVDIKNKIVFVDQDTLMMGIQQQIKDGFDWKQVMKQQILHEKTHEEYIKWEYKWCVSSAQYGGLSNILQDIVIDKIHFADNKSYQEIMIEHSRAAYRLIIREIPNIFPSVDSIPHVFYNQAASWVALGVITVKEAADLYPEKADYIVEMSHLFGKIKTEDDLEWAFRQAKMIFLKHFSH